MLKINEIETVAKQVLEKQGSHLPQIMYEINGKLNINILKFENDIEKDSTMKSIRALIQKEKINSYIIIMEAWISIRKQDNKTPYVRPKLDPKRKECLLISIYNRDMSSNVITNIFERDREKIKWVDRKQESHKDFLECKSRWNFYLEDISSEEYEKYINGWINKNGS